MPARMSDSDRAIRDADKQRRVDYVRSLKTICSSCGVTDPDILVFHHVDRSKKTGLVSANMTMAQIKEEVKNCIVLCHNCHMSLHLKREDSKNKRIGARLSEKELCILKEMAFPVGGFSQWLRNHIEEFKQINPHFNWDERSQAMIVEKRVSIRAESKKTAEPKDPLPPNKCKICGKETRSWRQLYCSAECRKEKRRNAYHKKKECTQKTSQ